MCHDLNHLARVDQSDEIHETGTENENNWLQLFIKLEDEVYFVSRPVFSVSSSVPDENLSGSNITDI